MRCKMKFQELHLPGILTMPYFGIPTLNDKCSDVCLLREGAWHLCPFQQLRLPACLATLQLCLPAHQYKVLQVILGDHDWSGHLTKWRLQDIQCCRNGCIQHCASGTGCWLGCMLLHCLHWLQGTGMQLASSLQDYGILYDFGPFYDSTTSSWLFQRVHEDR